MKKSSKQFSLPQQPVVAMDLFTTENLHLCERAIEASADGVIITAAAPSYDILYANQAFTRITGYSVSEVIGKDCLFLQNNDCEQTELQNINLALKEKREIQAILRNYRKDGSLFWNELHLAPVRDEAGAVNHFVGVMIDITSRKQAEEQLLHQITHDVLTGLPNRSLLLDRIQQAVIHAKRLKKLVTVLFLDMDRFKLINESIGREATDSLLKVVAERLLTCVRETDTVARVGGDEFVIMLPNLDKAEDSIVAAQKVLDALAEPFHVQGREINMTTSIGISLYPLDANNVNTLMRNANIAMYQAKELGRNNFQFYISDMNKRLAHRLALENGLRGALERKEFQLHYQPLFDLETGKVVAVEALLRWQHPTLGSIPPLEFIPIAEAIGLINSIGKWVLHEACKLNKLWQTKGLPPLHVAINLSGLQLKQPDIVEEVSAALKESGLNPKYLELEVTEGILIDNAENNLQTLNKLKDLGVHIVMDDFGTGYASLHYLKYFPIDKLKIDKTFVEDITLDPNDAVIAIAIIAMAKSLKMRVLAEGVETANQLEFLREHGCHEAQGYYFSKPLDAESLTKLLSN